MEKSKQREREREIERWKERFLASETFTMKGARTSRGRKRSELEHSSSKSRLHEIESVLMKMKESKNQVNQRGKREEKQKHQFHVEN